MVTFIVVMLIILCIIAFAIYLFIKKGKVLKRWFFAFGGVVLAGVICIAVAVPVTSSEVKKEFDSFHQVFTSRWRDVIHANYNFNQSTLKYIYDLDGERIAKKNAWLKQQQKLIATGIYWDLDKATRNKIQEYSIIPYVEFQNGEYILITE